MAGAGTRGGYSWRSLGINHRGPRMPSWLVGSSTDHREPLVFFELGGGRLRGMVWIHLSTLRLAFCSFLLSDLY